LGAGGVSAVTYNRLTPDARREIRDYGYTVAGYIRATMGGDTWYGDRCGCPDDRCIGHHHDVIYRECRCLTVILDRGDGDFPIIDLSSARRKDLW
jgi:hypothetical protein